MAKVCSVTSQCQNTWFLKAQPYYYKSACTNRYQKVFSAFLQKEQVTKTAEISLIILATGNIAFNLGT